MHNASNKSRIILKLKAKIWNFHCYYRWH